MDLFILRHGPAVNIGEAGVDTDAGRMLSPQGARKTETAMRGLAELGCTPRQIFTSPLVRAVETARIAAGALAPQIKVRETDALLPGTSPKETLSWLASQPQRTTLVVGHMPHLAALAAFLLGESAGMDLVLKKAGVCRLVFDGPIRAGRAALEWLLPPAVLRKIADR